MGFVLGPMMEENLRRVLLLSRGDFGALFNSPISIGFYLLAVVALPTIALPGLRRKREVLEERPRPGAPLARHGKGGGHPGL